MQLSADGRVKVFDIVGDPLEKAMVAKSGFHFSTQKILKCPYSGDQLSGSSNDA